MKDRASVRSTGDPVPVDARDPPTRKVSRCSNQRQGDQACAAIESVTTTAGLNDESVPDRPTGLSNLSEQPAVP